MLLKLGRKCFKHTLIKVKKDVVRHSYMGFMIDRDASENSMNVHKYAGKHKSRKINVYVAGLTLTGALGMRRLVAHGQEDESYSTQIRDEISIPTRLYMASTSITSASCGHGFTLLASNHKDDIKVWGCGINTNSQIGYHKCETDELNNKHENAYYDYIMHISPVLLPLKSLKKTRVLQVACGRAHSLILTDKEGVFSMGNNAFGQCGRPIINGEIYQGSKLIYNIPNKYFPEKIKKIVCGMDHSLFLTENGQVLSCGWGADGQTGLGHYEKSCVPTKVEGDIKGVCIKDISSFADVTLAISEDGNIFGWGNSEYQQLSSITKETQVHTPTKLPFDIKVKAIAAGGSVCAIVDEEGDVWVWGYGILGKGPKLMETKTPKKIPRILFGKNELNPDVKVEKVSCGQNHFCAITNKGEMYSWGKNNHSCLGIRSPRDQYFPWKVSLKGEAYNAYCGVDHTVMTTKALI